MARCFSLRRSQSWVIANQGGALEPLPGSWLLHYSTVFRFPSVHIKVKNYRRHLGNKTYLFLLGSPKKSLTLVCSGGYNRTPRTGWLTNNRNLFLTVVEAGSPRPRCWQNHQCLLRAHFLVHRWPSSHCPHVKKGARDLLGSHFFLSFLLLFFNLQI